MSSDRHRKTSLMQKFRNFELSTKDDIDTVTDAVSGTMYLQSSVAIHCCPLNGL